MNRPLNLQRIFEDLDKHASEFNFPVLDNAYVEMAATRMTVFKGREDWVLAFEVLGYSTQEGAFVDDLYAFGSCLEKEGFVNSRTIMFAAIESPLIDPSTEAWIADWQGWAVVVRGKTYSFSPQREEYTAHGIDVPLNGGPGSLRESQLMRFFVHSEGTRELYMAEPELRQELHLPPEMPVFLQTEQWEHPDIAGQEKPSENVSIRSILAALDSDSPLDFQRGCPNTEWWRWTPNSDNC